MTPKGIVVLPSHSPLPADDERALREAGYIVHTTHAGVEPFVIRLPLPWWKQVLGL